MAYRSQRRRERPRALTIAADAFALLVAFAVVQLLFDFTGYILGGA